MQMNPRYLAAAALLGVLFWVGDAAVDAWLFYQEGFAGLLLRPSPLEVYLRLLVAGLFVVGALAASVLVDRARMAREALEGEQRRLARSVRTVEMLRRISGLVASATHQDDLLSGACRLIVEEGGFRNAWISSMEGGQSSGRIHCAGAPAPDVLILDRLQEGWVPPCARAALEKGGVHHVEDAPAECGDCPHLPLERGPGTLTAPLTHADRTFGWIAVSPAGESVPREEQEEVIWDLARSLGLGLRNLIQRSEFARLVETTQDGFMVADRGGEILEANGALARILGYTEEELTSLNIRDISAGEGPELREERFREILEKGAINFEGTRRRKDGSMVEVEISAAFLPQGEGRIISFLRDITSRKASEKELQESEARFRELAGLLPEAVFEADLELVLTYANQKAFELFGYSQEDFDAGLMALDTLTPEDRVRAAESMENRFRGVDPGTQRYSARRKDGSTFPILFHASLIHRDGAPVGLRGIIVDLTKEEAAQAEARAAMERFRNIVQSTPLGMHLYRLNEDGELILEGGNPAADRILGLDHAALAGRRVEDAFPNLAGTGLPDRYREVALGGTVLEHDHLAVEGGEIRGAYDVLAFRTSPGEMALIFQDVTERRRNEERLKRSEERLRLATRSGKIGIWGYEKDSDTLEWDDLTYEIYGLARKGAEAGLERWRKVVHPDDLERVEGEFRASFPPGGQSLDTAFRIIRASDGKVRHVRGMAGIIRGEGGTPLRAIGTNWDITESKEAEAALRRSEEKFRGLIEQSNDAIYILYQNRFDLVNRQFCSLTGITPEEAAAPAFSFWDLVADESKPLIKERQDRRSRGEEVPDLYEFGIRARDGRIIRVAASVTEIKYREGKAVLGFLRDITEQRSLETQLALAQKMESIGRLSGGVAHDLNNLLTPIIGYGEILRDDIPEGDPRRESAEEIVQAGFRSRDLVRQLLAFSRQQTLEFKQTDLDDLIGNFQRLLRRAIREDIQIRITPGRDVPPIRGDRGQLEQVMMNLAVNAQDAMPEGGTIHMETGRAELDEAHARSRPGVTPGNYAVLSITDTGEGMDRATRERVFEPFFTTKEKGRGTGLGLATVYGIVKQHGGNIWVYSEPGQGTTFRCYFPAAGAESKEDHLEADHQAPPSGGTESILVVEDEEVVRKLATGILRRQGYSVLEAEDAERAISILDTRSAPVDLLLTDVVLPGKNGKELYREVARRFPGTHVIYMSGYSDDVVTQRGILEEGIEFIQKPFTVQTLSGKVREILDRD